MSIKAKQVAGVTTLVVAVVAILSAYHLTSLSAFLLEETASRAELLSRALLQRTFEVGRENPADLYGALQRDGGIRSILDASIGYSRNVTYAAIVRPDGIAVAHAFPSREGLPVAEQSAFSEILNARPLAQLQAVYRDKTYEVRQPLLSGDQQFGSIRIGVSAVNTAPWSTMEAASTRTSLAGLPSLPSRPRIRFRNQAWSATTRVVA